MDVEYVRKQLGDVAIRMQGANVRELLTDIAKRSKNLIGIKLDDQLTMAGILGSYLHQAYCDGRKLSTPMANGLQNEPRVKKLSDELDQEFIEKVLTGKIATSNTLWVEDNQVYIDIANAQKN